MQPLGIVSADQSAWTTKGCKEALRLEACKHRMPALYRSSTYKPVIDKETGEVLPYASKVKVSCNHDWVQDTVCLSRTNVDYLKKRSRKAEISVPVLEKMHRCWKLRFAVTKTIN